MRVTGVTFGVLALTLALSPAAAASQGGSVASPLAPACVNNWKVQEGGVFYWTMRIHNDCRTPQCVRIDTTRAPDTACVNISPLQFADVEMAAPSSGDPNDGYIRGIVLCE